MKTILIIEDEKILREAYYTILTQEGFTVFQAANGKEALPLLVKKPDVILLDLLMPAMDGFTFLKNANLAKTNPNTHVVAFSNLSDQRQLGNMLAMGVSKHLLKSSLSPKQLVSTIRGLLG